MVQSSSQSHVVHSLSTDEERLSFVGRLKNGYRPTDPIEKCHLLFGLRREDYHASDVRPQWVMQLLEEGFFKPFSPKDIEPLNEGHVIIAALGVLFNCHAPRALIKNFIRQTGGVRGLRDLGERPSKNLLSLSSCWRGGRAPCFYPLVDGDKISDFNYWYRVWKIHQIKVFHGWDVDEELKCAAFSGNHPEVIKMMSRYGFDWNRQSNILMRDYSQYNPLQTFLKVSFGSTSPRLPMVQLLWEAGHRQGLQILMEQISHVPEYKHDRLNMIEFLLKQGDDVNLEDEQGDTPLSVALSVFGADGLGVVKRLLDHGADINRKNQFGNAPLLRVASLDSIELLECALEKGADFSDPLFFEKFKANCGPCLTSHFEKQELQGNSQAIPLGDHSSLKVPMSSGLAAPLRRL